MLEQPVTQSIARGVVRLVKPYTYEWMHMGVKYRIIVPAGFEFDGASIPQIFWTVLGLHPEGQMEAPALIHDFMDVHDGLVGSFTEWWNGEKWIRYPKRWSWKDAALLFRSMMREAGIARWRRNLAYLAVRLAGLWRGW